MYMWNYVYRSGKEYLFWSVSSSRSIYIESGRYIYLKVHYTFWFLINFLFFGFVCVVSLFYVLYWHPSWCLTCRPRPNWSNRPSKIGFTVIKLFFITKTHLHRIPNIEPFSFFSVFFCTFWSVVVTINTFVLSTKLRFFLGVENSLIFISFFCCSLYIFSLSFNWNQS